MCYMRAGGWGEEQHIWDRWATTRRGGGKRKQDEGVEGEDASQQGPDSTGGARYTCRSRTSSTVSARLARARASGNWENTRALAVGSVRRISSSRRRSASSFVIQLPGT